MASQSYPRCDVRIDFGSASKRTIGEVSVSQIGSDKMVCLVITEPLPELKELTGTVEEHWTRMIHEAIAKQAKTGIPRFEKAHVHIRITAPRGTNNSKVWDTSNRAINVIINNLKGIFSMTMTSSICPAVSRPAGAKSV